MDKNWRFWQGEHDRERKRSISRRREDHLGNPEIEMPATASDPSAPRWKSLNKVHWAPNPNELVLVPVNKATCNINKWSKWWHLVKQCKSLILHHRTFSLPFTRRLHAYWAWSYLWVGFSCHEPRLIDQRVLNNNGLARFNRRKTWRERGWSLTLISILLVSESAIVEEIEEQEELSRRSREARWLREKNKRAKRSRSPAARRELRFQFVQFDDFAYRIFSCTVNAAYHVLFPSKSRISYKFFIDKLFTNMAGIVKKKESFTTRRGIQGSSSSGGRHQPSSYCWRIASEYRLIDIVCHISFLPGRLWDCWWSPETLSVHPSERRITVG